MTMFYTLEDVTKENIEKALDEIYKEIPPMSLHESFNPKSFANINDAVAYLKKQGDMTIEEYMDWTRKTCNF